jgi:hypothetical protein
MDYDVIIACEFSGIVRDAFRRFGYSVISCDLLDTERTGPHYKGDIRDILYSTNVKLLIAHPPCTYLCNSGVRWLYNPDGSRNLERWERMREGALFFKELLNAPVPKICIENPVMHKYAKEIIGVDFSQSIQPWQYGHGEVKRTCLWLKNLPLLKPSNIVDGRVPRIHHMGKSKQYNRSVERSRTYQGIADAMADQWRLLL